MAPPFIACRICHNVEGKLKNYEGNDYLIKVYEELTGCPFIKVPHLTKFCPSCACLIRKLCKFKNKCIESYTYLKEHIDSYRKIVKSFVETSEFRNTHCLSTWNTKYRRIIIYTHNQKEVKKFKEKKKKEVELGIWDIQHLTLPNDTAKIQFDPKTVDTSDSDSEISEPYTGSDNIEHDSPIYSDPVEPVIDTPVLGTLVHILDAAVAELPDTEAEQMEIKIEDEMEVLADQKQLKLELDPDPDNLTLQEIKAELLGATEMNNSNGKREKTAKMKENESKMSKKSQRLQVQTSRRQSKLELEEHFTITQFLTEDEQVQEFLKRRDGEGYLEGKYKCEFCLKSFKEQKWMDAHVRKHEPSAGTYLCGICKIRSPTPKLHRNHRDSNHTTRYACRRCPYITYNKAQALMHHRWHEGVEHVCQHCGATFRKYTTYMGHLRRAHPSSHICGACARSFVSAYGLNLHIKAVHKDINKLENDSARCEACDVTFVSRRMYVRHILTTDRHKDISKDILGCRKCGDQFDSKEEMDRHTHYKERKSTRKDVPRRTIKCDECPEVFSHPNGVYQHYLRSHPDTPYRFAVRRHYLCEQCGKTFKSPGLLQQHSLSHLGVRAPPAPAKRPAGRNSCRTCGKTYAKLSGLFRHKLTHLGVRRHKCHICEKAFTDTSNLKQHIQGVHLNIPRIRKR